MAKHSSAAPSQGGIALPPFNYLVGWYDASQITGLVDGDSVTTWPDASGHGQDLVDTGFTPPLYKTTGPALMPTGLPVVSFDGSQGLISKPGFIVAQSFTVICVGMASTAAGSDVYVIWRGGGPSSASVFQLITYSAEWQYYSSPPTTFLSSLALADTTPHIWSVIQQGNDTELRFDGTPLPTTSNQGFNLVEFFLGTDPGSAQQWPGSLGEVLIYNAVMGDAQAALIESYLKGKWIT